MIPVLHSVSYAGVWPGQASLTLHQFLHKAVELGFPAVMLMAKRPHVSPLDYDADSRRRLRDEIDKLGLRVQVIAGYNNFSADAEHGDVPHREIQIGHIASLAKLAADLGGGKLVRIFTAYEHPSVSYSMLWKNTVDAIRECAVRAGDLGVTIGVQNHHDLASHHDSLRDLIEAVNHPACKAMFDAWTPALQAQRDRCGPPTGQEQCSHRSPFCAGYSEAQRDRPGDPPRTQQHSTPIPFCAGYSKGADLAASARKLAPMTCHTTVADYQLRPRYHYQPNVVNFEERTAWTQAVPMGEGFIDYTGFLNAMHAGGYDGGVAYEMCSPLLGGGSIENLDTYARRFLAWMRAWNLENGR